MSSKDLSATVNEFMLKSAPVLVEATPMAYDMLKALARQLMFSVGTPVEYTGYVIYRKYGDLYHQDVISMLVKEAQADEISHRATLSNINRTRKRAMVMSQPHLLMA